MAQPVHIEQDQAVRAPTLELFDDHPYPKPAPGGNHYQGLNQIGRARAFEAAQVPGFIVEAQGLGPGARSGPRFGSGSCDPSQLS